MTEKYLEYSWNEFTELFKIVNSYYRKGLFEDDFDFSALESGLFAQSTVVKLKSAANILYQKARTAWNTGSIPLQHFSSVLRSITISFEIDEYYLSVPQEKKNFFLGFCESFLEEKGTDTYKSLQTGMSKFTTKIEGFPDPPPIEAFIKLADELLLFCLCGVNVRYQQHSFESYQKGLRETERVLEFIDSVAHLKTQSSYSLSPTIIVESRSTGLKGLANYFRGRFLFALGRFHEAESAFRLSSLMYLEKMNLMVPQAGEDYAEARTLSLRRSNLAEVIGLTNLYLVESRIDEALEILKRVRPLLKFGSGQLMIAYCDLLNTSVSRAKYSSNSEMLESLEKVAEDCLKTFEMFVPYSHFPHRANIELSLIYFYRAKNLPSSKKDERKKLYDKCLAKLNKAVHYAEQKSGNNRYKNRRILVEALTIRSHIQRNIADINENLFPASIKKAFEDAENAEIISRGLTQLESDAAISLGIVYRDLYIQKSAIPADKQNLEEFTAQTDDLKKKSRDCFFRALELNIDYNPRVSAICYLRLTELEMLYQTNYLRAKLFFSRFKEIEKRVGHQYVLEFANDLEKILEERSNFEFFVDPSKELNFSYWKNELEKFLIEQTIFYTAREIQGNLPARRKRNDRSILSGPENQAYKKRSRETRQSVLAKALTQKMGMAPNKAYEVASSRLEEFENWCNLFQR